jgi:hypothetical protein
MEAPPQLGEIGIGGGDAFALPKLELNIGGGGGSKNDDDDDGWLG